jgi:NLR family CARD domain-containing protein 3
MALKSNVSMKKLNLARNKLGNDCMKQLAMFLESNDTLDELYLHFNCIQGLGGETMLKGLAKNRNLTVFDVSFNSIGVKEKNIGKYLKEAFQSNTTLVHCDFSFNSINFAATQMAAKGLEENHRIYGVHWIGNDGYMDPDGFLIPQKKTQVEQYYPGSPISKLRIQGTRCLLNPHNTEKPYLKENCWICEGWQELTIHYIPGKVLRSVNSVGKSGNITEGPIYCHFDYLDYKGLHMNKNEESFFEITRMVPPGERKYFFTHNSVASIAQDQGVLKNVLPKIKGVKIEDKKIDVFLPEVNFQIQKIEANEDEDFYVPTVKPRMRESEDDGIKPWSFEDSVFREYKREDDELLEKCFIFDFTNSKISKILKDPKDLQTVKDMLWKVYRQIKDTYKYYSAIGVSGDLFSIPVNAFTDFLNNGNVIDNRNLKLADTDLLFITTNTVMNKQAFNPDRALVRYQFLEIIVRLAMDKYHKTKISPTPGEALANLMVDLRKVLNVVAVNDWRTKYLWNHKCDLVFKTYLPILKDAYHRYCGQKTKPGMKKFMCLEELRRFCVDSQLLGESFQDREIFLAYNFSVMLQVDEVNNDRHLQMYFPEFIEAFARIADRTALIPFVSKVSSDF